MSILLINYANENELIVMEDMNIDQDSASSLSTFEIEKWLISL